MEDLLWVPDVLQSSPGGSVLILAHGGLFQCGNSYPLVLASPLKPCANCVLPATLFSEELQRPSVLAGQRPGACAVCTACARHPGAPAYCVAVGPAPALPSARAGAEWPSGTASAWTGWRLLSASSRCESPSLSRKASACARAGGAGL